MGILKALAGLFLIFFYHIPKWLFLKLQLSYLKAFHKEKNLTADPKEHLKRAEELLKKNDNSLILYAALEIRFATERMVDSQLQFSEEASKNTLKKYDPVKKKKAMTKIDSESDCEHEIYFTNKETGDKIKWGMYKPLELEEIRKIRDKMGDLLHPKVGLNLGIPNDTWYVETKGFLNKSLKYLRENLIDNNYYFAYKNVDQFELIKTEREDSTS
jgi:hypothetical protein